MDGQPDIQAGELREALDRAAIREVQLRYATGLDRRDFAMVRACFTEDAQASYNGRALDPGVDAVVAYVRAVEALRSTMHSVTNVVADLADGSAEVETTTVAYLVRDDGNGAQTIIIRGLRYRDRMVRRDGTWLIQHRVHAPEWMHEVAGQPV
ncbi:MAG TPA: nuclear transport factor 2 family protein [Candidatus Angelobacter sp.]|nr:nuclear transport factor 2 family protein [Candidatus Angelobacter sp.]